MYDNGTGVPEDDTEAVKWYRLAEDQGDADAKARLKELAPQTTRKEQLLSATASTPAQSISLMALSATDKQRADIWGCQCKFSAKGPARTVLIAGEEKALYRLNDGAKLCAAPDDQVLFDGAFSFSCGRDSLSVTLFGEETPSGDGHSSKARLNVTGASGAITVTGTWECGC